jgi:DNA-binding transcriptional ArsR family regulator
VIGDYELPDEELVDEESRPVKERILAALKLEGATIRQLCQSTGAADGTIRNKLSELRNDGLIEDNGRKPATYSLLSSSPKYTGASGDDDNSKSTVAEFFANPPDWLPKQLAKYRENPEQYINPLCTAVAAVVLGDRLRWEEVREEVERILEEGAQG